MDRRARRAGDGALGWRGLARSAGGAGGAAMTGGAVARLWREWKENDGSESGRKKKHGSAQTLKS
jgi:hypothetical protein